MILMEEIRMKKKYGTRLIAYFAQDIWVIGVFVLGVVWGSVYALSIRNKDTSAFLMLNNYIFLDTGNNFQVEKIFNSIYAYFKQLFLVWVFGLLSFTIPLGLGVFFVMTFSYAFTTTCMILIYGLKGLMVALFAYGLQAIIILATAMYLSISSLRKNTSKVPVQGVYYNVTGIIPVIAGSCMIALLDLITGSNLHAIATWLLTL